MCVKFMKPMIRELVLAKNIGTQRGTFRHLLEKPLHDVHDWPGAISFAQPVRLDQQNKSLAPFITIHTYAVCCHTVYKEWWMDCYNAFILHHLREWFRADLQHTRLLPLLGNRTILHSFRLLLMLFLRTHSNGHERMASVHRTANPNNPLVHWLQQETNASVFTRRTSFRIHHGCACASMRSWECDSFL